MWDFEQLLNFEPTSPTLAHINNNFTTYTIMNAIRLELDNATSFLVNGELDEVNANVPAAQKALEAQTCPGNDFLGWMHLPSSITPEFLSEIKACAATLR